MKRIKQVIRRVVITVDSVSLSKGHLMRIWLIISCIAVWMATIRIEVM